jgi:ubiquinone/menaquinone biosynthesis C-methylase UbiE
MDGWTKKRRVMRRYDAAAHIYDMRYHEEQARKIEAAMKGLKIDRTDSVLDVGCGTGILFDYVGDSAGMTVGLDVSRKTLVQAKSREKPHPDAHLVWADADNVPIRNGVFSRVFAVTLIQNTPRPDETLKEIGRVARDDAVVVVTGLKKVFTGRAFERLLKDAGLRIASLEGENLRCYVAVCTKTRS